MRDEYSFRQATRPAQRKGIERWWAARKEGEEGEKVMVTSPSSTSAFRLNTDTFPRRRRRNNLRGNEAWRWMGTLLIVIRIVGVSLAEKMNPAWPDPPPPGVGRPPPGVAVIGLPNTRHVDDN